MTWEEIDWAALERLRGLFLSGGGARAPYWRSPEDLASYDFTYGERIGWKWDAVLQELRQRAWAPPGAARLAVFDWGCGSGVAGRRVVSWLGPDRVGVLRLWDQSALAVDFAAGAARARFPGLRVEHLTPGFLAAAEPVGLLVISHVLNELPAPERQALLDLTGRADAVLWVEPGTSADSRALIEIRETLRDRFRVVAPCTHQAACGLLVPANARHWCHHFAAPPPGIFVDSSWMKFGRRAGIDLRSLPYAFLALERTGSAPAAAAAAGFERVIGEPRFAKGVAKVLSCGAAEVRELTVQKRDAPALLKQLKRPVGAMIYRWTRTGDLIRDGAQLVPARPGAGGDGHS